MKSESFGHFLVDAPHYNAGNIYQNSPVPALLEKSHFKKRRRIR